MKKEKVVIKEIGQKESMVEAGQSTIVNGSKSQFLEGLLTHVRVLFYF
jgi:hypothetical protein